MNHTARENTHKDSQASLTTLNVKKKMLNITSKIKHYEKTQGNTRGAKQGGVGGSQPPLNFGWGG